MAASKTQSKKDNVGEGDSGASYGVESLAASVSHVEFEVPNGPASVDFLAELLGWRFSHFSDHYWLCESAGSVAVGLLEKPEPELLLACPVFIQVDDIEQRLARAVELGGVVLESPQTITNYGQWAKIKEPGGNTIGLFQKA